MVENPDFLNESNYFDIPDWIKNLRRPTIHFIKIKSGNQNYAGIVDYSRKNKLSIQTENILQAIAKERKYHPQHPTYDEFTQWNQAYNNILDGFGIIDNEDACYEIARHLHQLEKTGLIPSLK